MAVIRHVEMAVTGHAGRTQRELLQLNYGLV